MDYRIHIIARDEAFEQILKLEKGKNTHRICETPDSCVIFSTGKH